MSVTILEIEITDRMSKACPIKLPSYSGDVSEDFIALTNITPTTHTVVGWVGGCATICIIITLRGPSSS
jgi:hypothetical protein